VSVEPDGYSRRQFLKGLSAGAIGAAALTHAGFPPAAEAQDAPPKADLQLLAGAGAPLEITINGAVKKLACEPRTTLLALMREKLEITGPKDVCDRGACGACTVLVDGKPVVSCMTLAHDCAGARVETVEGLGTPEKPHPLQKAFAECDALQCGFCTPGMVMSLKCLLDRDTKPSLDSIKKAVEGNVCRCGTYPRIFEAADKAALVLGGGK
jgi:aerobic-type carbon monoxide dehydrogenase small subunit (CoxS/CutS family)